jgi:hypothetical protein
LREHGGDVTYAVYDWVNHLTLIGAFSPLMRLLAPVERDVCAFIDRVAAARGAANAATGARRF